MNPNDELVSKLIKKEEDADWAPVLPVSVQFRKQKQFCCNQWHFPGFLLALPRAESALKSAGSKVFLLLQEALALIASSCDRAVVPASLQLGTAMGPGCPGHALCSHMMER